MAAGPFKTTDQGGQRVPSRRYKKDIIATGTYVKVSDGIQFQVTPMTMGNWVLQFQRMRSNGVKVPIPATHQTQKWEKEAQSGDPRDNMGFVDEMWVDGGTLWMACTLHGNDAIVAAARADVSIFSPPKMIDGGGNAYLRPITHVAMVTDPVVPDLGQFIPLAASLRLAKESPKMLEFLQQLGAALGLDPAQIVDEETGVDLVTQAVNGLLERAGEATEAPEVAPAPGAASQSNGPVRKEVVTREFAASMADMKAQMAALEAKVTGVKPGKEKRHITGSIGDPNPLLVKTVSENRAMKLSRLISDGKITEEQAEKLEADYCSDEAVALALSTGSDGSDFDRVIEVFELTKARLDTSEKTAAQTRLSLSDTRKASTGDTRSPLVQNAERRAAARKAG